MPSTPPKASRPLSPHLQVYKPQLTSGLSIFHRITGIGLCFGLLVFVAWLVALAKGPDAYAQFLQCAHSIPGQIVLFGITWAFFFHFCTGVRHLLWDAGLLLDIKNVYRGGYIALLVSTLMTVSVWLRILVYPPS